jgi:hypothetical protein
LFYRLDKNEREKVSVRKNFFERFLQEGNSAAGRIFGVRATENGRAFDPAV